VPEIQLPAAELQLGSRFPAVTHILTLVEQGLPAALTVDGAPQCQIRINPELSRIEVLVKGDGSSPEVQGLRNIGSQTARINEEVWKVLWADWTHTPIEVYQFACDVIDRVQQLGETLAVASEVVLIGMKSLLRQQTKLTRESEVGLFGELLVLEMLAGFISPTDAVAAWLGPYREEHDFALGTEDLEIKTTTSESRAHWISSISQLAPVGERPLTLISVQVTPKDGDESVTLGQLVNRVLEIPQMHKAQLLEKLEHARYSIRDADLYPTKWALRGPILEFSVTDSFPRLLPGDLERIDSSSQRITELTYRINLEGLEPDPSRFES
jgi:hypothetical protein